MRPSSHINIFYESFGGQVGRIDLNYGQNVPFPIDEVDVWLLGFERAGENEELGLLASLTLEDYLAEKLPGDWRLYTIGFAPSYDPFAEEILKYLKIHRGNVSEYVATAVLSPILSVESKAGTAKLCLREHPLEDALEFIRTRPNELARHHAFLSRSRDLFSEEAYRPLLEAYALCLLDLDFGNLRHRWESLDRLILESGGIALSHRDYGGGEMYTGFAHKSVQRNGGQPTGDGEA